MEEVLYNIEIHRNEGNYMGKIYSDIDGVKEFENNRIDRLLRDIIVDMQLALDDEFSTRMTTVDLTEFTDEVK
jgi:divalent metal cation (Fe/Co/Zn/Cd) transporter